MVERNYIRNNRERVRDLRMNSDIKSHSIESQQHQYMVGDRKHKSFGRVPGYLARKRQLEEDERMGRLADPVPPGTRLLSEQERLEALYEFEEKKKDISMYLGRFPIANRPLWIQRKEKELLEQMDGLDAKIREFKHDRVYVRINYDEDTS